MRNPGTFCLSALLLTSGFAAAFGLDKSDVEYPRPDGKPLLCDAMKKIGDRGDLISVEEATTE